MRPAASLVALTASNPSPRVGLPLMFTATDPSTLGGPTPTGTVQFEVDGSDLGMAVALVNGAAASGSVALTAGSHTINAVYSGDATYAGTPASLTLSAAAPSSPTVALNAGNSTAIAGQALAVMVLVTPPAPGDPTPTGTVQFEVDGTAAGTPVALGGRRGDQHRHHAHGRVAHDHRALLGRRDYAGAMASLTVTAAVPTATVEVTATSPLTIAGQPRRSRPRSRPPSRALHADRDGPVRGRWQ